MRTSYSHTEGIALVNIVIENVYSAASVTDTQQVAVLPFWVVLVMTTVPAAIP